METNVEEVPKEAKAATSGKKRNRTDERETPEVRAPGKPSKRPLNGIQYGFHVFFVVLSRIIGGCQSFYERLFAIDEQMVGSDFHKEHGFSAYEKGDYPKAAEHFLCANKEKAGKDAEVLFYLGLSFAHQEEYAKAAGFLKRAEALKENDADIVSEIGHCFMKLEQYLEAIEYLKKAIALMPQIPGHFYTIGTAYEKTGSLGEAIQHYSRAIELEPRDPLYHQALGFAYESEGKHADAIGCFKKAMELEKRNK